MQAKQPRLKRGKKREWLLEVLRLVYFNFRYLIIFLTFFLAYERRSKFIKGTSKRKLWKQLTPPYMSDEETDKESNGFTVHKLSWRSNVLNRLLSRLDGRYDESRKNSTIHTKPREQRKLGEFSLHHSGHLWSHKMLSHLLLLQHVMVVAKLVTILKSMATLQI